VRFVDRNQHSIQQFEFMERLTSGIDRLPLAEAMFVATQLVMHGSDRAESTLKRMKPRIGHPDALLFLDSLCKQLAFIQNLTLLPDVKNDLAAWSKLYDVDGFFFARGSSHSEKLLVVF